MNRPLLGSLVAFALVGSAHAADMLVKVPVQPAFNWTGFYFGANVGGGWGNQTVSYSPNDPGTDLAAVRRTRCATGAQPE